MIGYLGVMLVWSIYHSGSFFSLVDTLIAVASYVLLDLIWTYVRDKVWYVPSSSVISGLILSLIGPVGAPFYISILMAAIAVASKQLIKLQGGRHIFNPAAFSLVVLSAVGFIFPALSAYGATWWGVSWSVTALHAVLIAGLFIWWRQSRIETALSFFASYISILGLIFFFGGVRFPEIFSVLWPQIYDGTVIFFASVMLIEPITSGFPGKKNKIIYGILVGAIAAFSSAFATFLPLDPLLLGLLSGNLIISLIKK